MKRLLRFGLLPMGFSFTVTQGLMVRELLVAFFGNELSIGLILGNWLILEAVGSGLLDKLAARPSRMGAIQREATAAHPWPDRVPRLSAGRGCPALGQQPAAGWPCSDLL